MFKKTLMSAKPMLKHEALFRRVHVCNACHCMTTLYVIGPTDSPMCLVCDLIHTANGVSEENAVTAWGDEFDVEDIDRFRALAMTVNEVEC